MYGRLIAICVLAILLCRVSLGETTDSNVKRIRWNTSTFDSFVQALENTKPLVLVILSNSSHLTDEGKNVSNAQRVALDDLRVHAMADDAVFVMSEFDHRIGRSNDEFTNRIMKHAEVTKLPAILIIANRSDNLHVASKLEGVYQPEELVVEVRSAIRNIAESLGKANAMDQTSMLPPAQPRFEHNPYELQPMSMR